MMAQAYEHITTHRDRRSRQAGQDHPRQRVRDFVEIQNVLITPYDVTKGIYEQDKAELLWNHFRRIHDWYQIDIDQDVDANDLRKVAEIRSRNPQEEAKTEQQQKMQPYERRQ